MLTRVLAAGLIVLTVGCGSSAPAKVAPTATVAPATTVAPTTTAAPTTTTTPQRTIVCPDGTKYNMPFTCPPLIVTIPPTTAAPKPKPAPAPTAAPKPKPAPTPAETASQVQANRTAADYLRSSSFSCQGLIGQLLYEGFSQADSEHGAFSTGLCADGGTVARNNAARTAADYLRSSGFSCQGLIDQLLYEKFSQGDAEYGAFTTGICA